MNTPAFPKPSQMRAHSEPIEHFDDGREVCNQKTKIGKMEYRRRVLEMARRQGYQCGLQVSSRCPVFLALEYATFEHVDGRGMGGSHQDDRIEKDGKPYNCAACVWCNIEKGSKRAEQS